MEKILNYLWRLWFVILLIPTTLIFGFFAYLFSFSAKTFSLCYVFIRLWCLTLFYGMGFRFELDNTASKRLSPDTSYIFISNHTSVMDIMLMCILHPHHPICFVGKKELVKIPIFGGIYKRICVMVDRSSLKSRMEVYRRCSEKIKEGQNIVIFPEGGVPDEEIDLASFKDGAFSLSSQYQVPIAVYTFVGLKKMFPFSYDKGYPGRVKVILNDILTPHENKDVLKNMAFELISDTIIKKK
ncbi:1-acyl-sn-glycerol-3-phosphate acyltransferase [Elizabethkingia sp. JS20170427COW]|uniref:lysophospholipid acyltransferase family protein n=1 Tax=Elizabethkingia sp. JS20170427COW TaxID=2583851 RepID=UPI00111018C2|nr:lysophospholipid acyltransferase family protein [Elizabethkingia sp. JS20170427COW]QCX52790.1 1-acyl-sn-glycerol-3-phosphate acyltransferase [Elizabethkingia sp. JS20170427COW]